MKKEFGAVEFLQTLKAAEETGILPADFHYSPKQVKEKLKAIRSELITIQQVFEQLSSDPKELTERVTQALTAIDAEYAEESKFLNVIISQKLAPESFYEKIMHLMCDLSNVKSGLVEPRPAYLVVSNYEKLLQEIRADEDLRSEAAKFAGQAVNQS